MLDYGINFIKVQHDIIQVPYIEPINNYISDIEDISYFKTFNKTIRLNDNDRYKCPDLFLRFFNHFKNNTLNTDVPLAVSKIFLNEISLEQGLDRAISFLNYYSGGNKPNQILLNHETLKNHFKNSYNMSLVANGHVPDNYIYLTCRNDPGSPGFAYYYTEIDCYDKIAIKDALVNNGYNAEKQTIKIQIIK